MEEFMESEYPTYATKSGKPYPAYVAECIGNWYSIDGGGDNYRGKNGVIGSYTTGEEAIEAAKREKTDSCTVRVTDTRAEGGSKVIFEQ
jgi:hypothetical protein